MSDRWEEIGTPTTVGEIRELIKDLNDDDKFGFINQPLQSLYKRDREDGTSSIGFQ